MRMIVHAFEETLDKGLQKDGEIVPMSECDAGFERGWQRV
jgi:hypothetical protein